MKNIEIENKTIRIYSDEIIISELMDVENVDEFSVHVNTISGTYLIQLNEFTFNGNQFNSYDELKLYLDNL
jgi:hypothetical protein